MSLRSIQRRIEESDQGGSPEIGAITAEDAGEKAVEPLEIEKPAGPGANAHRRQTPSLFKQLFCWCCLSGGGAAPVEEDDDGERIGV